ncbi:MAG: PKD domain-containing protein [Candidatus Lokiarchaeota archaeon]|nr:PKD domain-containing protein [Candidatus Lokiarchaeota archaeon]
MQNKTKLFKKWRISLALLFIVIISDISQSLALTYDTQIEYFYTDDMLVDVGETVRFQWNILYLDPADYVSLNFGDGNQTLLSSSEINAGYYEYVYKFEGSYNATLVIYGQLEGKLNSIWKSITNVNGDDILIEISNRPPQFEQNDIQFQWDSQNGPYEDEIIQVSVNINDSDFDLENGNITYIFDLGDGEQLVSNENYVTHTWITAGVYPITVTVQDDQGALTQRTRFLEIKNKAPNPKFSLGAEIPATYSFSEDIIGDIPFGWNLSESVNSKYAFEIVEEKNSHGNVLSIISNETISTSDHNLTNDINFQDFGTIEFHYLVEDSQLDASGYMAVCNDKKEIFSIFVDHGNWKYCFDGKRDNFLLLGTLPAPKNNVWYHVRIDICTDQRNIKSDSCYWGMGDNEFRVNIDGSPFVKRSFESLDSPISIFSIGTFSNTIGKIYIDSIGYSWDSYYNVGDNFDVYSPEYYGTYDWREGIIGSQPNGWEVYNDDVASDFETNPFFTEDYIHKEFRYYQDSEDIINNWVYHGGEGYYVIASPENLGLSLKENDTFSIKCDYQANYESYQGYYIVIRVQFNGVDYSNIYNLYYNYKSSGVLPQPLTMTLDKDLEVNQILIQYFYTDIMSLKEVQIYHETPVSPDLSNYLYREEFDSGDREYYLYNNENTVFHGELYNYLQENYTLDQFGGYVGQLCSGVNDGLYKSAFFYDDYWYIFCHYGVGGQMIFKYPEKGGQYIEHYNIYRDDALFEDIWFYDGYWYALCTDNDRIYIYDFNWVDTNIYYDINDIGNGPIENYPSALCFHDGYCYILGVSGDESNWYQTVYKWTTDFSHCIETYNLGEIIKKSDITNDFDYYDGYWYILNKTGSYNILKYDENWNFIESSFYPSSFTGDSDFDYLTDFYEISYTRTDPNNPDTDGDGFFDSVEYYQGTNPLDPNSSPYDLTMPDNDGDKLSDIDEINIYYTDPNNPDTDQDGVNDQMEVFIYSLDPLNPNIPDREISGIKFHQDHLYCINYFGVLIYNTMNISKIHQNNEKGYIYIQTNKTETLRLRSPNNLYTYLHYGDKINIKYDSRTSNVLTLKLYDFNGNALTYDLIEPGTPMATSINLNQVSPTWDSLSFTISEDIYIDYIEIGGVFYDKEYLLIDSITFEKTSNTYHYVAGEKSDQLLIIEPEISQDLYLRKGVKIEFDFITSSSHEISLVVVDPVGIRDYYIISPEGNTNFNRQKITLSIREDIYMSSIEIRGLLERGEMIIMEEINFFDGIHSDISYIDAGDDFGKVIQICDRSSLNNLWMENEIEYQNEGTLEFWFQTSNVSTSVWSLNFFEGTSTIFKLFIDNNEWRYSLDGITSSSINGLELPNEYQWCPVKINFDGTLNHFQISVNNSEYIVLENVEFNGIDRLRFETFKENKGTFLLDAIGYSWDKNYNLGENQISYVVYPEKTNIQFSAADSTDTISDYDSLQYFWDFGDNSSGYGKYISHNYLTSGNYNITLICKDNNGVTTSFTQIVKIYNTYPEIEIGNSFESLCINEGETIFFNAESWDDITDFASLDYYWSFETTEDSIYAFDDSILGGWRQSHLYEDDYSGKLGVMVKDSEGDYNYDLRRILVKNVDPLISIYDAYIISNISFEVVRSDVDKHANFSFELVADNLFAYKKELSLNQTNGLSVSSTAVETMMSLSNNWRVNVLSDGNLPEFSWFRVNIHLEFLDGQQLTITSGKIYGEESVDLSINLNPYWVNVIDNTFKYPITMLANIFDPSTDDITIDINYYATMLVEISCSNFIPCSETITISKELGPVSLTYRLFEEEGKKYFEIRANQKVYENNFYENDFPTQIDFSFDIYPIFNIEEFLIETMNLENLNIINYNVGTNRINAYAQDDDNGSNTQIIKFDSIFEFENLSPSLEIAIPNNDTINTEVSFIVKVSDFDQLESEKTSIIQEIIEDDIPSIPTDIAIRNGSICNTFGDLQYNDNEYVEFSTDHSFTEDIVFFDDFNDGVRDPNWQDHIIKFGLISEKNGYLNIQTNQFGIWEDWSIFFSAYAPYSTIPLSLFSTENWEVMVEIVNPYYDQIGFHNYGLLLYENEKNVWLFGASNEETMRLSKIVNGHKIDVIESPSDATYLKIRKMNNRFYFEYSIDNQNWNILEIIDNLEINPTHTGLYHRSTASLDFFNKNISFDNFTMRNIRESDYYLDFTSYLDLDDLQDEQIRNYIQLNADMKLDSSQIVNISIYNFNQNSWELIESTLISNDYYHFSYTIPEQGYLDIDNRIYIRFEILNDTNSFHFFLDKLQLMYSSSRILNYKSERIIFKGFDIANQEDGDIYIQEGLEYAIGDLSTKDNDYAIFNSTYNTETNMYNLSYVTGFSLNNALIDDKIDSISCLFSFRTNISQNMEFSIFNFTSNEWIFIDTFLAIEFSDFSYNFDINQSDLYLNNEILIKFELVNQISPFSMDLDLFRIDYEYLPHYILSDNIKYSELNLLKDSEPYATYIISDNYIDFVLKLKDLDQYRKFQVGILQFSFSSNLTQYIDIFLYNYSENSWSLIKDDMLIYEDIITEDYYIVNSTDFINSAGLFTIRFEGASEDIFKLYVENITMIYKISEVWGQFGDTMNSGDFISLGFLSNEYEWVYYGLTNFTRNGDYLVIITADDGNSVIRKGGKITILDMPPYAKIGFIKSEVVEDEEIQLTSELFFYGKYAEETRFEWSFGDGNYAYEQNPLHAWNIAGTYNITLKIVDSFGNSYTDNYTITIEEEAPEITGPYTFSGIQGQAVVLNIDVSDSFFDEMDLQYEWYNVPKDELDGKNPFSYDQKPVIFLDCGNYTYSLKVIDSSGMSNIIDFDIEIEDIPPVAYACSYMYHGARGNSINLHVYVYDSYLENDFTYEWTILNDDLDQLNGIIWYGTKTGVVTFVCMNTIMYMGQIIATDKYNRASTCDFYINSFIDTNGNTFSDELEAQLRENGIDNPLDAPDDDGDGISDILEDNVFPTDPTNPDSDNDGLYDGIDPSTGLGEFTYGTYQNNDDTDSDGLLDGVEVYGWNISINSLDVHVYSHPKEEDTDGDGLSDFEEYMLKYDPKNSDTDNDGFPDTIDPYPVSYDYDNDGLSDFEEYTLGTALDVADTDGDGLSDGEEVNGWYFKTNPLSQDSDHDLLSDTSEIMTSKTNKKYYSNNKYIGSERVEFTQAIYIHFDQQIQEAIGAQISFTLAFGEYGSSDTMDYGFSDHSIPNLKIKIKKDNLILYENYSFNERYVSQVIDIKDLIENATNVNYYGRYYIEINNYNAKCMLEDFNIEVIRYLDPNDSDFDNDGLLDGVETQMVVKGWDTIDFSSKYLNNLTTTNSTEEPYYNEIILEIPSIGIVDDALLDLEIISEQHLTESGDITIELVKDEIDNRIEDPVLISEFNKPLLVDEVYNYNIELNLKNLLNSRAISEYYGKYILRILINTESKTDNFTISKFSLDINTWIYAGINDWSAWITDPARWSTDKDGFSDSYEIEHGYNPQSEDTDGDGVWDDKDVDPLHNVILKIDFREAYGGSHLEAGVNLKHQGNDLTIWTPYTINSNTLQRQYYIDIDDNRKTIDLNFYLYDMHHIDFREIIQYKKIKIENKILDFLFGWLVEIVYKIIEIIRSIKIELPDTKIGEWNSRYTVQPNSETSYNFGKLYVKVSTIPLNRINTIAVFEENSTFSGHYESQEKMNVLILHVKDEPIGYGNPFVKGLNTVLIPTRIFEKTKLNAKFQKEELSTTPLAECEFSSIERDDSGESNIACENIDFVVIQEDLTAAQALEILNLLREVLINDTTSETALLNTYISTKYNNIAIEQMNVNNDVLGISPYNGELYQNSPQGDAPKNLWESILQNLENLGNLIISFVQAVAQIIEHIIKAIVDIAMEILSNLGDLMWILIRAAILILAYITLALDIIAFIQTFILFLAISLLLVPITGKFPSIGFLSIEFEILGSLIKLKAWIEWIEIKYYNMSIPILVSEYTFGTLIMNSEKGIILKDQINNMELNDLGGVVLLDSSNNLTKSTTDSQSNKSQILNDITIVEDRANSIKNSEINTEYLVHSEVDKITGVPGDKFRFSVDFVDDPVNLPNLIPDITIKITSPRGIETEVEMQTDDGSHYYRDIELYHTGIHSYKMILKNESEIIELYSTEIKQGPILTYGEDLNRCFSNVEISKDKCTTYDKIVYSVNYKGADILPDSVEPNIILKIWDQDKKLYEFEMNSIDKKYYEKTIQFSRENLYKWNISLRDQYDNNIYTTDEKTVIVNDLYKLESPYLSSFCLLISALATTIAFISNLTQIKYHPTDNPCRWPSITYWSICTGLIAISIGTLIHIINNEKNPSEACYNSAFAFLIMFISFSIGMYIGTKKSDLVAAPLIKTVLFILVGSFLDFFEDIFSTDNAIVQMLASLFSIISKGFGVILAGMEFTDPPDPKKTQKNNNDNRNRKEGFIFAGILFLFCIVFFITGRINDNKDADIV